MTIKSFGPGRMFAANKREETKGNDCLGLAETILRGLMENQVDQWIEHDIFFRKKKQKKIKKRFRNPRRSGFF